MTCPSTLQGVKAGIEAAAKEADRELMAMGFTMRTREVLMKRIRALDPSSIAAEVKEKP